jgi:hypothetical protein
VALCFGVDESELDGPVRYLLCYVGGEFELFGDFVGEGVVLESAGVDLFDVVDESFLQDGL